MLPKLFWSITFDPEYNAQLTQDVLEANENGYKSDELEEAIWTLFRNIFRAAEKIPSSTSCISGPVGFADAAKAISGRLDQASEIIQEMQRLIQQRVICQEKTLSDEASAIRSKVAMAVARLSDYIIRLGPSSTNEAKMWSNALENSSKHEKPRNCNLRTMKHDPTK